jgi:transcriptional regulator with XRE-family HTH domain
LPNYVRNDYQQAREALGARFRQLRKDTGLTGKQLAERLGWSQPKVSRIERGQRTPSEEDLRAFARVVGATAEVTDELLTRVRTVHSVHAAWRRQLAGGAAVGQHDILELEASVRLVRAFEPAVIPGMLETDDYARKLFDDVVALYGIPNDAEEAVRIRLHRQQLIHDPARRFEFIIAEAALRSQVCPPPVMRAQLDLVRALSNLETVEVFILPTDAKLPFLPLHGFWIFDDELVSVETVHTRVEARDPSEVALYLRVFGQLKAAAQGEEAARALLTRVIEDWRRIEDSRVS